MDSVTRYHWLSEIRQRWGDGPGGKVLQRLLELAFADADFRIVEERLSEGIDFDVERRDPPNEGYSFEARTTTSTCVPVKSEDLRQMDERMKVGYQAGVAALRIAPGAQWVFVERCWLLPPSLRISTGTARRWESLAKLINAKFDTVLERFGPTALEAGIEGLRAHIERAHDA